MVKSFRSIYLKQLWRSMFSTTLGIILNTMEVSCNIPTKVQDLNKSNRQALLMKGSSSSFGLSKYQAISLSFVVAAAPVCDTILLCSRKYFDSSFEQVQTIQCTCQMNLEININPLIRRS